MPLAPFGTLTQLVAGLGGLGTYELSFVVAQLATAVRGMHAADVSHADLKPCQSLVHTILLAPEWALDTHRATGQLGWAYPEWVQEFPAPLAWEQPAAVIERVRARRDTLSATLGCRVLVLARVWLADFDRSVRVAPGPSAAAPPIVGTVAYGPPEAQLRRYGAAQLHAPACGLPGCGGGCAVDHVAADVFSLGLSALACAANAFPVYHADMNVRGDSLRQAAAALHIAREMQHFDAAAFIAAAGGGGGFGLSGAGRDWLAAATSVEPRARPTMAQLCGHPWLHKWAELVQAADGIMPRAWAGALPAAAPAAAQAPVLAAAEGAGSDAVDVARASSSPHP
jgi:serine/threonine protein kinase